MLGSWQPIETAPKDGTEILAVGYRGKRAVVSWDENTRPFDFPTKTGGWSKGLVVDGNSWVPDVLPRVTHWMPLPDAP